MRLSFFANTLFKAPLLIPKSIRAKVLKTPLLGFFRDLYRKLLPDDAVQEVQLQEPLAGHRMLINLQMHKAFMYGTFEPTLCKEIMSTVKPGWICADVGANVGYYTLLMASLTGSAGRVFAFEPLTPVYEVLSKNVMLNHYEGRVQCEVVALANKVGTEEFVYRSESLTGGGSLVSAQPAGLSSNIKHTHVQLARGDEYFAKIGVDQVDFIKIDVEGAEALVLEGLADMIAKVHPCLLIEMHTLEGSTMARVEPMLKDWGYAIRWIDGDHIMAS